MKLINQVQKRIYLKNKKAYDDDRASIVIVFQFITMTGIVAITGLLLLFTILKLSTNMDFRTVLPIIPMEKMIEQRQVDRLFAKQIINEIYDINSNLEVDFFARTYSKREFRDSIKTNIYKKVDETQDLLSYEILEVHQDYGTNIYDPDTKQVILTESSFSALVKEFVVSREAKVTADTRAVVVQIEFDRDKEIKAVRIYRKHELIYKNNFTDFLSNITPETIKNQLSYKSPVSSLSMSFMEIKSVAFGDLKMTTSTSGMPIGNTILIMNGDRYVATVEYSNTGKAVLIIE